jgi:hypothetical protein
MKIITIIGFGRSGMDLLQSLFDGHEQISQFPGYVNFASFYKKINNSNNASFIADTFIHNYQGFFNSKFNKFENHHKLGAKKNESYRISKVLFKKYLKKILSEYSKKNILTKLHLAYSMANGEDIYKKKIILINVHNINNYTFYKDIDFEIFCTIRNPFNSLGSAINNWLNYKNGKHVSPWFLYFHIDRIFNLLDELQSLKKKIYVIKLDLLHTKNIVVMKNLCKNIGIKFSKILLKSTYHNKQWWGDVLSAKPLNGINNKFTDKIKCNLFFKKDVYILEYFLKDFFLNYKYKLIKKKCPLVILLSILPMKIELKIWFKTIRIMRIFDIVSIPYYWIKRIKLMFSSKIYKKKYPPFVNL